MKILSYVCVSVFLAILVLSNMVCTESITLNTSAGGSSATGSDPISGSVTLSMFCPGDVSGNGAAAETRTTSVTATMGGVSVGVYAHPRLWLSPAKITHLQTKATTSNFAWAGLDYTNQKQLTPPTTYATAADSSMLINFTLGYLGNGSTAYLNAAKTILASIPTKYNILCDGTVYCGNVNLDYGSMDLVQIGLAYDWLYAKLTDGERLAIRNWVFDQFIPFLRKHPYYYDPAGSHADASPVHNLTHTKWIGELMWSLATVGDDDRALPILDQQYKFWRDQIAPIFDKAYVGGHSYGGSGYGYNRSYKFALYGMEALKTATSVDGYAGHAWAVDGLPYRFHSVLPSQGIFHSDWESSAATFVDNKGRMTENEALMVSRFQGNTCAKWGQYFLDNIYQARAFYNLGGNPVNAAYIGLWFIWYDPAYESVTYFDQPTAYVASGLGVGFSRSSWSDTKAAWTSFSASEYFGDHQLHNEGSFKIWKNGEYLVIENGPCYAANNVNTNISPRDANVLFFNNWTYGGTEVGGFGGRGNLTKASIIHFSQGPSFSYFLGDLTNVYVGYKMNTLHRAFVHFNPASSSTDDYFIVADRIDATSTWQKQQFIHVAAAPTVVGNDATISTTNNYLHVRALGGTTLASQAPLRGDGTTDACLSQEATDTPTLLTITRPAGTAQDLMMTVLHAGPTATMPTTVPLASNGGELTGVLIADGIQNRVFLMGTTSMNLAGTITTPVTPTATAEYVITDLMPSQKYDVTFGPLVLTPSSTGAISTDDQGTLRFTN